MSEVFFEEEQPFRQGRLRVVLAAPPLFFLYLLIWQVVLGHPWGKRPMSNGGVIFLFVFLSLLYLRLTTIRLGILVSNRAILVSLRGALWHRRIPIDSIESAKIVAYHPVRDYGGYGIRSGRAGRAYIAAGNRGVLLRFSDRKELLLGTGRPSELAAAILRAKKLPLVASGPEGLL